MKAATSMQDLLTSYAAAMELSVDEGRDRVRCVACGHRCLIPPGRSGICKVRFNRDGRLYGPRGYVSGLQLDPIEKKPFFHAYPGSRALSFGMLGCDFHCGYCQNWVTSQALRDPAAESSIVALEPEDILLHARRNDALVLTSTYNEPLITSEWAMEVFRPGKAEGFITSYVSNGNSTPEVIEYIKPWVDLYKIDLKGFDDKRYRKLGGTLQNVLDGIDRVHRAGLWLELVTLIVPGFNDGDEELRGIAGFIAELSPDIPWHITAFHPDYNMRDTAATSRSLLLRAHQFGRTAGLRFVYAGNLPGRVGNLENTYCPGCDALLVERTGYRICRYELQEGRCWQCEAPVPGLWHTPQTISHTDLQRSA